MPTRGVERWLTQRLSAVLGTSAGRGDGICANVDFPFPATLVGGAVAAADRRRPGRRPVAAGPVGVAAARRRRGAPRRALAGPLSGPPRRAGDATRRSRRFSSLRHVADLYDRYARPPAGAAPGLGRGRRRPLAGRAVAPAARADRHAEPGRAAGRRPASGSARDPALVELPRRLSLFGLTRLPASQLSTCSPRSPGPATSTSSCSTRRPCSGSGSPRRSTAATVVRRDDDPTAALPHNPLLASWGRDVRELQLVLAGAGPAELPPHRTVAAVGRRRCWPGSRPTSAPTAPPPGLPLPGARRPRAPLDPDDRSLQVHACHGRARQVEVVRDAILHVLPTTRRSSRATSSSCAPTSRSSRRSSTPPSARPPLDDEDEPGAAERTDLHVRLADRSLRQTNPVLGVVAELLELADGRLTASQVLDLAGRAPVRRRFRLDDDDLARIAQWAADERRALGARRRAARRLPARTAAAEHLGGGLRSGARRRHDGRGAAAAVRRRAAARRRRQRRHRPRRPLRRAARPAARGRRAAHRRAMPLGRLGRRRSPRPPTRSPDRRRTRRGSASSSARLLDDVAAEGTAAASEIAARAGRDPRPAGRPAARPADPGELPHRPPHDVHARADALGAAPGRLPDGPRRRRLPAADGPRRRRPAAGRSPRRRPRRPQRGPPAAARRGAGGDRPPGRHLHRPRRAHQRRASAGGADRRAARRRRAHRAAAGAARDRHRAPAAAVRRAQLRPGALSGPAPVELRPGRARRRPGAGRRAPAAAAVPLPAAADASAEPRSWSSTSLVRFVQHPVRAFLRQRLGIGVGEPRGRDRRRPAGRARRLREWGVGERLLRRPPRRRRARGRGRRRARPRRRCRRAASPTRCWARSGRASSSSWPRPRTSCGDAARAGRRRAAGAPRRPAAGRHGARRARRPGRLAELLAARRRATAWPRGSTCWPWPRPTRSAATGR